MSHHDSGLTCVCVRLWVQINSPKKKLLRLVVMAGFIPIDITLSVSIGIESSIVFGGR